MSIDTAASDLADELSRQSYVEILCHHDADGISAGSIMATALFRAGIPFRLRITHRVSEQNLPKTRPLLLCDLGSGLSSLPEDCMVIDHHLPFFEGPFHVNPRLFGIDGDTELSAAGAAYLVANAFGDNRDLAGLFLLGVVGDGQALEGKNRELYLEGMGNGVISKKRGIRLPGRTIEEQIMYATEPFLPGVSGSHEDTINLIAISTTDDSLSLDMLMSLLVLNAADTCRPEAIKKLWGDTWQLEREVIEDAFTMTCVVDACGKAGYGSDAASLCLRATANMDKAYGAAFNHRSTIIQEMSRFVSSPSQEGVHQFSTNDRHLVSDLADSIYLNIPGDYPVIVSSEKEDNTCICSIRGHPGNNRMLGEIVHNLALECGGTGGGHQFRAGATISCEQMNRFTTGIAEVCGR